MATTKSAAASITVLMGAHNHRFEVDGVAQLATVDSVCTPTVKAPTQAGEGRTNPAVEVIAAPMQSNRAIDPRQPYGPAWAVALGIVHLGSGGPKEPPRPMRPGKR
jgi:hypothetical protein